MYDHSISSMSVHDTQPPPNDLHPQDKRRRAAAKAVTQQSTAPKGSLFKDPKRVVVSGLRLL